MARVSMNEMTTYRWSFEEDVLHYAAAGIRGIGVWRHKLSDYGEEKGIELLAEHRLQATSLMWGGGFTGSDGRSHRESIDDAKEGLRTAALLRAPAFVLYTGGRSGHTHNHARRLLRSALSELQPQAEELGVQLVLEPMNEACAADWTFLTKLEDAAAMIDEWNLASVRLVLDTYHFGHDPAMLEKIPALVPYLGLVHLADSRQPPQGEQNRCPLGQGTVPLRSIVQTLRQAVYDGCYDIELIGEEIEASDYHSLLLQSKQFAESLL